MDDTPRRRGRPKPGQKIARPQRPANLARTSVQIPHPVLDEVRSQPGYTLAENLRVIVERYLFLTPKDDEKYAGLAASSADLAERVAMKQLTRGDFRFFVIALEHMLEQHMLEYPRDADRGLPLLVFLQTSTVIEKMQLLDAIVARQRRRIESAREDAREEAERAKAVTEPED